MARCRYPVLLLAALGSLAASLAAQGDRPPGPEAPSASIAVFAAALYNDQANLREATDSTQAAIATEVLRARLRERLADQVLPFAAIDSLERTSAARSLAGGVPCNVRVACALSVGRALGARWIVLTKVSKTSNLIWLLSAQLIRVATGAIILDDSTELKGEPGRMVGIGTRIFADRVVRAVQQGGYTTNFPR
jgi:Protein of unknown function (DUF2380)